MSELQATLEIKPILTARNANREGSTMKAAWAALGIPLLALTACGGGNATSTVTVTASPSQPATAPEPAQTSSDGTLAFGQAGQTYPGLWVTVGVPKTTSFSSNSSSDGDLTQAQFKKRVNFLQTVTYVNKTGAKVDIGGEGVKATVVRTGVECPRVFDTQVEPSAGTGPILPGGKRKYVVGFSCAGKAGEQVLVAAWGADANTQGDDVSFVGTLP